MRATAHRVDAAGDVAWHSPAAYAFRGRVGEMVLGLRRVAQDLDEGAAAIELHAAAVQAAPDLLGRLVHSGRHPAHGWIRQVSSGVR